jgi:hypothetical protein
MSNNIPTAPQDLIQSHSHFHSATHFTCLPHVSVIYTYCVCRDRTTKDIKPQSNLIPFHNKEPIVRKWYKDHYKFFLLFFFYFFAYYITQVNLRLTSATNHRMLFTKSCVCTLTSAFATCGNCSSHVHLCIVLYKYVHTCMHTSL